MTRYSQSGKKSTRVADVLADHGSPIGQLLKQGSFLMQLHHVLSGFVDPSLAAHFQVAAARDGKLVLIAPSASWATQLRMQAPSMLEFLRNAGFTDLRSIKVRVAPLVEQATTERQRKPLSPAARQAIDAMKALQSKD